MEVESYSSHQELGEEDLVQQDEDGLVRSVEVVVEEAAVLDDL